MTSGASESASSAESSWWLFELEAARCRVAIEHRAGFRVSPAAHVLPATSSKATAVSKLPAEAKRTCLYLIVLVYTVINAVILY